MNYTALIVAAGSGTRMGLGYNKLLYKLKNDKTVLGETLAVFINDQRCTQIIVVTSETDHALFRQLYAHAKTEFVLGGDTRQASVYHGLQAVKEKVVLIHDGARPWLSKNCIDRILVTLKECPACLLGVALKDTIKEVKDGYVVQTYRRETLIQAQTPQAFDTELIKQCYEKAMSLRIVATDDAQIVERCSDVKVRVVQGDYENSKVTTIEDLTGK